MLQYDLEIKGETPSHCLWLFGTKGCYLLLLNILKCSVDCIWLPRISSVLSHHNAEWGYFGLSDTFFLQLQGSIRSQMPLNHCKNFSVIILARSSFATILWPSFFPSQLSNKGVSFLYFSWCRIIEPLTMKSYYAFFKVLNNYLFLTNKSGKKCWNPYTKNFFFSDEKTKIISPHDQDLQNNNYMLTWFSFRKNEVSTSNKTDCFKICLRISQELWKNLLGEDLITAFQLC